MRKTLGFGGTNCRPGRSVGWWEGPVLETCKLGGGIWSSNFKEGENE